MASTRRSSILDTVFYACLACYLVPEVLSEISSPDELIKTAGQDAIFQFNTTGNNAIKGTKFGLSDGSKDYPNPKFMTVLLKNGVVEEICGEDLYGPAAARYKGRVSFVGDLKKGQAWFKISNLSVTDTNLYMCKIRQDSDDGYKRTNRVTLTVLEKAVTKRVREAKYTNFIGIAKKTCKSYRLLREESHLTVNVALGRAYWNMTMNHIIKIKTIRKINKTCTVTAWFHIMFAKAINTSYAFSFLGMAQRNNRLRGYNITFFGGKDVKLVPDFPKGLAPWLILTYVIIALAVVALVTFCAIWKFRPELLDPFYKLVRRWSTRLRETVCNASTEDN